MPGNYAQPWLFTMGDPPSWQRASRVPEDDGALTTRPVPVGDAFGGGRGAEPPQQQDVALTPLWAMNQSVSGY